VVTQWSTSTMPTEPGGYLPALRFSALTRLYDPVVRATTREGRFKEMLVEQAAPTAAQRILDLGCGTGTLAIQVK
jgi:ubiquinone/menaquinone biosynthesis C-methylase UbiE